MNDKNVKTVEKNDEINEIGEVKIGTKTRIQYVEATIFLLNKHSKVNIMARGAMIEKAVTTATILQELNLVENGDIKYWREKFTDKENRIRQVTCINIIVKAKKQ